jgi:acetolactate synthase-1/2/3 large subunit
MEGMTALTAYNRPQYHSCADRLIRYLEQLQISCIFGVPGMNNDALVSAAAASERSGGLKWILSRSETGAAYMADGFYRECGRLAVCCSTSGPGFTNMMTPVANAYVDGIPMLVITAQPPSSVMGRGAMQEMSNAGVDALMMFSSCTRYNSIVSHIDQLEPKLLAALSHATGPTPGPVHLAFPADIFQQGVGLETKQASLSAFQGQTITPNDKCLKLLEILLRGSRSGVVVIGEGCESAVMPILKYAEYRQWPVVTTPMGRGLISSDHPLFRGVFGMAGHESARQELLEEQAETVLVVGVNLDETATCGWDGSTILTHRMIHVNANPERLARSHMAKLNVLGSPVTVFDYICDQWQKSLADKPGANKPVTRALVSYKVSLLHEADCHRNDYPINPRRLISYLSRLSPSGVRCYADAGNSFFWATHYWQPIFEHAKQINHLRMSMSFASMGWAAGAAIGSAFANKEVPVLCLMGDGSYLMNSQEISVACQHNLNVVFVILNDSQLGTVRHGQKLAGNEDHANKLPKVNYAMIASAMKIEAYRINTIAELEALDFPTLFEKPRPVLLDILIDPEVSPPMGIRVTPR